MATPVPHIDHADGDSSDQRSPFRSIAYERFRRRRRGMRLRNERHGLSSIQIAARSRSAVVGRLAPGVQAVETLLVFSGSARIFPVHVNAERAAVDLDARSLMRCKSFTSISRSVKIALQSRTWSAAAPAKFA